MSERQKNRVLINKSPKFDILGMPLSLERAFSGAHSHGKAYNDLGNHGKASIWWAFLSPQCAAAQHVDLHLLQRRGDARSKRAVSLKREDENRPSS